MTLRTFIAVDLGATSGRIVNVGIDASRGTLALDPVRRFRTVSIPGPGGALTWEIDHLLVEVRRGLVEAVAQARGPVESVAIDSWAVDYGFLDAGGKRLGPIHAYRSSRTDGLMESVTAEVGRARLYGVTGIQFLPFNTIYQLVAARHTGEYREAAQLLMLPDLLNHELCGSLTNDITNASTTQLLDTAKRQWSDELVDAVGLRRDLLPELHEPGTHLGVVRGVDPAVDGLPVVATASHDTASGVAGIPLLAGSGDAYVSCGTWALVGTEVPLPVTAPAALEANVTNELGACGTVRLLKNVTGLWLFEECRRAWTAAGTATEAELEPAALLRAAEAIPGGRSVVDPDEPAFHPRGDMPRRIAEACEATGQPVPETPAEFTRVIVDSLALAWRRTVSTIERVSGRSARRLHLVGGGSAVPLLRRLAASACERPVSAGPVEATVVGNALVQAIAAGVFDDLEAGRALVRRALPADDVAVEATLDWGELEARLALPEMTRGASGS